VFDSGDIPKSAKETDKGAWQQRQRKPVIMDLDLYEENKLFNGFKCSR
jgi:hypothetical protein